MKQTTSEHALVTWVLPALLWLLTWFIGGLHYETNDDLLMSFIARGIAFGEPVGNYSIYFHGFGNAFVWLYQQFPAVPWYGLILYLLLFIATQLAFGLIYKALKPHLRFRNILAVLLLFYVANWYEHAFWFNYMRVPFLLSGVVFLKVIAAGNSQTKFKPLEVFGLCLLLFLALCIRPAAAALGVLVVLPAIGYYHFRTNRSFLQQISTVLPFLITGLAFVILVQITTKEQAEIYRKTDTLKSGVVDYQWCCGNQKTTEENLIVTGLNHWFLADSKTWTAFPAA